MPSQIQIQKIDEIEKKPHDPYPWERTDIIPVDAERGMKFLSFPSEEGEGYEFFRKALKEYAIAREKYFAYRDLSEERTYSHYYEFIKRQIPETLEILLAWIEGSRQSLLGALQNKGVGKTEDQDLYQEPSRKTGRNSINPPPRSH